MGRRVWCIHKESGELLIIHTAINGTFGNLEAVNVYNWEDGTRFGGIDVLVCVPCTTDIRSVGKIR